MSVISPTKEPATGLAVLAIAMFRWACIVLELRRTDEYGAGTVVPVCIGVVFDVSVIRAARHCECKGRLQS